MIIAIVFGTNVAWNIVYNQKSDKMKQKIFGKGNEVKMVRTNVQVYLNDVRRCKTSEDLVEGNLSLVISIANIYSNIMPTEDLIQEGNYGLIMAANDFNEELGCAFSTFATPYIRRAILEAIERDSRLVRRPHHQQSGFVWNESLDEELSDGEGSVTTKADMLADEDNMADEFDEKEEISAIVSECLDKLTERERYIVTSVFGIGTDIPMGYKMLACELGISEERVRQIYLSALKKMRK